MIFSVVLPDIDPSPLPLPSASAMALALRRSSFLWAPLFLHSLYLYLLPPPPSLTICNRFFLHPQAPSSSLIIMNLINLDSHEDSELISDLHSHDILGNQTTSVFTKRVHAPIDIVSSLESLILLDFVPHHLCFLKGNSLLSLFHLSIPCFGFPNSSSLISSPFSVGCFLDLSGLSYLFKISDFSET